MQTNNILSAPLIDIIFDDRNKDYGAYELRKTYERRIIKSLIITITIVSLAITGTVLANSFKKNQPVRFVSTEHTLIDIKPDEKPPEIEQPEKKPPEQQVRTQIFVEPKIVIDKNFDKPLPEQHMLDSSMIDTQTRTGDPYVGIATPPQDPSDGKGIVAIPDKNDDPVSIVEIDAKFTGNWEIFLRRNLNPEVPINNNAPAGTYSILIQFVVDKEGNVSDVIPLTNHGYGMEQEAVRVLKRAAKWEPAIQNGYVVKAYRRQPITFQVLEDE